MGEINSERCGTYGNVSDHDRKTLEDLRKKFKEGDTSATVAIDVIDDLLGHVGEGPQVEQDASKGGDQGQQTRIESTYLNGTLQIDHNRGVIYFHISDPEQVRLYNTVTALRICQLPRPIPSLANNQLDITHMFGTSWGPPKK